MKTKDIIILVVAAVAVTAILYIGATKKIAPTSQYADQLETPTPVQNETQATAGNNTNSNQTKSMNTAVLTTNKGVITLELYTDEVPNTSKNFKDLAQKGFYNGTRFHRVIKGFMIQGGDPLSKDLSMQSRWGTGDPGYKFADEINASSEIYKVGYKRGVIAMANSGPNTNGSQFFIMHQDYPLPPLYTIFGKVVSGQEVVDAIATTPTEPNDRPSSEIVIQKIEIK